MFSLNLPKADIKLQQKEGKTRIFDPLRRRYVVLTPEEWVRQHFVSYLIHHLGYPAAVLGNEVGISVGETSKRCDTLLYDRHAQPLMIIEYKAPHITLNQRVFDQISRYNMALHVDYLIVSNGMQHYCCRMNYTEGTYHFLREIPRYEEIVR